MSAFACSLLHSAAGQQQFAEIVFMVQRFRKQTALCTTAGAALRISDKPYGEIV